MPPPVARPEVFQQRLGFVQPALLQPHPRQELPPEEGRQPGGNTFTGVEHSQGGRLTLVDVAQEPALYRLDEQSQHLGARVQGAGVVADQVDHR